jgi:N-methylhydantoinase A
MLVSEPRQDFIRTRVVPSTDENMAEIDAIFAEIEAEARAFMDAAGYPLDRLSLVRYVDMRYAGQEHTVRVAIGGGIDRAEVEARFHDAHERAYTFRLNTGVEFVNFHITAVVTQDAPDLGKYAPRAGARLAPKQVRRVAFDDGTHETAVYERADMPADEIVTGPAIIEEPSATTVVHPGQRAHIDRLGNLILELEA